MSTPTRVRRRRRCGRFNPLWSASAIPENCRSCVPLGLWVASQGDRPNGSSEGLSLLSKACLGGVAKDVSELASYNSNNRIFRQLR